MGVVYGDIGMNENVGDLHTGILRGTKGDTQIPHARLGGVMRPAS